MHETERVDRVRAVLAELVDPDDLAATKLTHVAPLSYARITELLEPHEVLPGREIRRTVVTDQAKELDVLVAEALLAAPSALGAKVRSPDVVCTRANAVIRAWSKDSGHFVRVRCEAGTDEMAFLRIDERPAVVLLEARRLLGFAERDHSWLASARSLLFF
jgi:hypothetical protein